MLINSLIHYMIASLKNKLYVFFTKGNVRSLAIKKNIIGSLFLKCISILVSLQVVPLTIDYVNPTQYGIWLTLSSIIAWLSYFDLGFAHGFRNRFTEAKAKGDLKLAKEYVSTTYAILFLLFSVIFIITIVINQYLDWGSILNIDESYNKELRLLFGILACFFCMNFVASIFTTMLTADQKPALSSLIQTSGQVLAFIGIYFLTKTTSGNLTYLAFVFSGIPCFFLIIISIFVFAGEEYKSVAPSFSYIRFVLTKRILGLGGQFFVIMISMLFIFQFINIILSRVEGPEAVTQYNIAYKYFHILHMVFLIILAPFWSAFTDAYVKQEYGWMKAMVGKLEKLFFLCIPVLVIMLLLSGKIYEWWIGDSVQIPFTLSLCLAIYTLFQISGSIYMYIINGTGKVQLQLIVYVTFSLISIPLMNLSCKMFGVEGIVLIPIVVYSIQTLIGKMQVNKILNSTAKGIWLR